MRVLYYLLSLIVSGFLILYLWNERLIFADKVPQQVMHFPDGFKGLAKLEFDPQGEELEIKDGKLLIKFPKDGLLRVKNLDLLRNNKLFDRGSSNGGIFYNNGNQIPLLSMISLESLNKIELYDRIENKSYEDPNGFGCGLYKMSGQGNEGYITYFVGGMEEYKKMKQDEKRIKNERKISDPIWYLMLFEEQRNKRNKK